MILRTCRQPNPLRRIFLAIAIVLIPGQLFYGLAQSDGTCEPPKDPLSLTNRYGLGECRKVLVHNGHLLYGSSSALTLFDLRDRTNLRSTGNVFLPDEAHDIAAADKSVYVANGRAGLSIVDISNPASPKLVGRYQTPGGTVGYPEEEDGAALSVSLFGHYAVVGIKNNGLEVVDVSSSANPVAVGRYAYHEDIYRLAVYGHFAYAASNAGPSLKVFDLNEPARPRLIKGVGGLATWAKAICRFNDRLYVFQLKGLSIYDLSRADDPKLLRTITLTTNSEVHDACISGAFAYVVGSIGLKVLDLHEADEPKELSLATTQPGLSVTDWYAAISSEDHDLYLGTYSGFNVLDISKLPAIEAIGEYRGRTFSRGVAVRGDHLYLSTGGMQGGIMLLTMNMADPVHPREISEYKWDVNWFTFPGEIAPHADRLYCLVGRTIAVFSLKDPDHPALLGEWRSPDRPVTLCFDKNVALLLTEKNKLVVLNLSQPAAFKTVGSLTLPGRGLAMRAHRGYAYLLVEGHGLLVVDLRMPDQPKLITSLAMQVSGEAALSMVEGPRPILYVVASRELRVLDVSEPGQPAPLGSFSSDYFYDGRGISLVGHSACAIATRGVFLFDVLDPAHPILKGRFPLAGLARGVASSDRATYVTTDLDVIILDRH